MLAFYGILPALRSLKKFVSWQSVLYGLMIPDFMVLNHRCQIIIYLLVGQLMNKQSLLIINYHELLFCSRTEKKQWMIGLFSGCATLYACRTVMPLCAVPMAKELGWDRTEAVCIFFFIVSVLSFCLPCIIY